MPYDVRVVANKLLDFANRDGEFLDPMKIQKLVYVSHGWFLALFGEPLISQSVEAWKYGPVIPVLYDQFKSFRASPVTSKASAPNGAETLGVPQEQLLDAVWKKYRPLTAMQLSVLTHEPGYAWDLTMKETGPFSIIRNELIRDEFMRRKQRQ